MLKIIEKEDKYLDTHTCPVCQEKPLDKEGMPLPSSKTCEHLVYLGHIEGAEIDKLGLEDEDQLLSFKDITNKLDNNYVGFEFYAPAPSGMCIYFVYKTEGRIR